MRTPPLVTPPSPSRSAPLSALSHQVVELRSAGATASHPLQKHNACSLST